MIRIFPNEASALCLIGALLAEKHDEWQEGAKYLNMEEYWEFKKEMTEKEVKERNQKKVISISD